MSELITKIEKSEKIAIIGHLRPDGDSVGSALGLYNYVKNNYPNKDVRVFLQKPSDSLSFMKRFDEIRHELTRDDRDFDLLVVLDVSSEDRMAEFGVLMKRSREVYCVDHHVTNDFFKDNAVIEPESSSTCEVLFRQLDNDKIDKSVAECLYTGIVHDTGVFKFSSTNHETMKVAGKLMAKGIDFTDIINNSFYAKTYNQQRMLGYALEKSKLFFDGKVIVSTVNRDEMEKYGCSPIDLDSIVPNLKLTTGVEVALFFYQLGENNYKVSLRSENSVDVSIIAKKFGGGGHVRASGCEVSCSNQGLRTILEEIKKQL